MNFIRSNIWEISRSTLLSYAGAFLSLIHIINYFFWSKNSHFLTSADSRPLLCWDFLPNCTNYLWLTHGRVNFLFTVYLVFSILALIAFLMRRFAGFSWTCLFLTSLAYASLYTFDASLRQDAHALILALSFALLFVPSKANAIRALVILFYFISAIRELNPDWLSGIPLQDHYNLPLKGLEWVNAVSIIIKLTLPFILISNVGSRVAISTLGLMALHGFHFIHTKDFSSLALFLLVLYFVFDHFETKKVERESYYQSYEHPEPTKLWWPAFAALFIFIQTQFVPRDLPTEIFRVTGPITASECKVVSFAKFSQRLEQMDELVPSDLNPSLRCHPKVVFNIAKSFCQNKKQQPDFETLSMTFLSRRLSQPEFKPLFSSDNICADNVNFAETL